ncbi:MAG: YaaL family protein [Bacillota bacterium]|nr:YaaL family protein [Bacillota bacterium]
MNLMKLLNKKEKTTKEELIEREQLLLAIKNAAEEIRYASEYINYVKEPKLLDYAIYNENAVRCRYEYLIRLAKEKGIENWA